MALVPAALGLVVLRDRLRPALGQAHVLLALAAHVGLRLDRVVLDLVGPVGPVALAVLAGLVGAANLVLVCLVVLVGMAPCRRNQLGRPSDKALLSSGAARCLVFSIECRPLRVGRIQSIAHGWKHSDAVQSPVR